MKTRRSFRARDSFAGRIRGKPQPPPAKLARASGFSGKATLLDRMAMAVSPAWGARRLQNRLRGMFLAASLRKYDGADSGRRTQGWNATGGSANAEVGPALQRLRRRSRDLVRNNAWAKKAVGVLTTRTIGKGLQPELEDPALAAAWRQWALSTDCDFHGKHNLGGLQAKVARGVFQDGEALIRRVVDPDLAPIPLRLQVLEADHLDDSKDGKLANGNRIVQGVEIDTRGRVVAYWIFPDHPGEDWSPFASSIRVEASEVLHVFREDRAGQLRGVPWGSSVILPLHDWDEYSDAQLLRQKIASAFVGFVRDLDAEAGFGKEGADTSEDVVEFEPGVWEHLPAGKTIEFARPPTVEGFADYSRATLHQIAAGFGVTFEALTGDFSQVTFTSGRMGHLEFAADIECHQSNLFVPQLLNPILRWAVQLGQLAGTLPQGLPTAVDWIPPRREMIDPAKELKARILAVRAGFSSLSAELRREGKDPRTALEQLREDLALLDELELEVESDPRRSANGGGNSAGNQAPPDGDRMAEFEALLEDLEDRIGERGLNGHAAAHR